MFKRIMAVVLAVILLLTIGISALGASAIRRYAIDTRLEELKKDAR